jgi:probable phosphoglycerate mutase
VVEAVDGRVLAESGEALGVATAAEAELRALVAGLSAAAELGLTRIEVRMDSQLAVAQASGERAPRSKGLRRLLAEAGTLAEAVGPVTYLWVSRDANGRANALVAGALGV